MNTITSGPDADAQLQVHRDDGVWTFVLNRLDLADDTRKELYRVLDAFDDRVSISIHAYGDDIGNIRRHVYDPSGATRKAFVSGYANADELKPG